MRYMNKTLVITCLALMAFAANSVLCRLAFSAQLIDPVLFTSIRLVSGALMLLVLVVLTSTTSPKTSAHSSALSSKANLSAKAKPSSLLSHGSWSASSALFAYALCFSIAYLELATGTGALVLFASVQLALILMATLKGYRLTRYEWLGLGLAFAGLVYLLLPSIESPSLVGFILMAISGIAWAIYTVLGLKSTTPLLDTWSNFSRAIPVTLVMLLVVLGLYPESFYFQFSGVVLALISGAITSGLGYFLWYIVLPRFSSTQAGVLQLSVPLIATVGGIIFVNEALTLPVAISGLLILCGILTVLVNKHQ